MGLVGLRVNGSVSARAMMYDSARKYREGAMGTKNSAFTGAQGGKALRRAPTIAIFIFIVLSLSRLSIREPKLVKI